MLQNVNLNTKNVFKGPPSLLHRALVLLSFNSLADHVALGHNKRTKSTKEGLTVRESTNIYTSKETRTSKQK